MSENPTEAAILTEHYGKAVPLCNGKTARVIPFNVEDLLSDELASAAETIFSALWQQAKILFAQDFSFEVLSKLDLMAAFKQSKKGMHLCLSKCVDVPLKEVPLPDLPLILEAFIQQNFSPAQLKSWAGLLRSVTTTLAAINPPKAPESNTTSATAASSSSTTATPDGGSTLPPNSNTGSGDA